MDPGVRTDQVPTGAVSLARIGRDPREHLSPPESGNAHASRDAQTYGRYRFLVPSHCTGPNKYPRHVGSIDGPPLSFLRSEMPPLAEQTPGLTRKPESSDSEKPEYWPLKWVNRVHNHFRYHVRVIDRSRVSSR